jgi:hypothetical protein
VPESPKSPDDAVDIDLKDPAMAAFLAWLIPGLGHWYQGRRAKAVLYFVCIMATFCYGVYLGGNRELGWGRAVYFSWRDNEWRLPYLAQIGIGVPALPALVQAHRMANHQAVWWHGFMAPPRLLDVSSANRPDEVNLDQPTLHELHRKLHQFFDLGTVFTMIAGLLNILAIYDAASGPVIIVPNKEERPRDGKADATPSKN